MQASLGVSLESANKTLGRIREVTREGGGVDRLAWANKVAELRGHCVDSDYY